MEGDIVDLSKKGGIKGSHDKKPWQAGRGGGLHGLSGDKHVQGRYTGQEKTNPEKQPKLSAKYKERLKEKGQDTKLKSLYGNWMPDEDVAGPKAKGRRPSKRKKKKIEYKTPPD